MKSLATCYLFNTFQPLERFWCLMLDEDVKWFSSTCHPCQTELHIIFTFPNYY